MAGDWSRGGRQVVLQTLPRPLSLLLLLGGVAHGASGGPPCVSLTGGFLPVDNGTVVPG